MGAKRTSELSSLKVTAGGAMYVAVADLVNVNTVEGSTSSEVNSSEVKAGQFSVNAENEDHLKVTDVTATGAIGSLGASVVVSYLKGSRLRTFVIRLLPQIISRSLRSRIILLKER